MRLTKILSFTLGAVLSSWAANVGQDDSLASRIIQALKEREPSFRPIAAIESGRVPMLPNERRILVATWDSKQFGGTRADVMVSIYSVENLEDAAAWLKPTRSKGRAPGWRTDPYPVGDEAYLAKYKDGERFEIHFRKGLVVGRVAGNDLSKVTEFTDCIVAEASRIHIGIFSNPQRVTIRGYSGDAMEPFLTRDGKYLFFNNLNEPIVNTNLYWAERVDDLTFQFKGEIAGVNTPALEGVPSMDRGSNFYFISPRSYDKTASTIYQGHFANGVVTGVELVPGVSLAKPGIVNFDAEISADGNTLYFVESQFDRSGHPRTARILFARRKGSVFVRAEESARILQTINTDTLNYAVATTSAELEIFFTRLDPGGPAIYTSTRPHPAAPFGMPAKIEAITGFVEGPTLSPDEKALYYHKRENGHFVLYRVTRN